MKRLTIVLAVVAIMALTFVSGVSAQGNPPPALSSGFQLQNRSTTEDASILITYYDENGVAVESDSAVIPAKASAAYYVPNVLGAPDGRYSVVVSSSQDLFAMVNEVTAIGATPNVEATHSGFSGSEVGSPLYLPWVVCEYYNFNSMFAVQNAGSATTNITVEFYQSGQSTPTETYPFSDVLPGEAVFLDLTQNPYNADLTGFFGSVVISSDGDATPLAAVLNDTNPTGSFLRSYNAVLDNWASTTLYGPQVTANYYGFSTGITLQNPNAATASVDIYYYPSGSTTPVVTQTTSVAANSAKPIYLPNVAGMPTNFNGSAVVESSIPILGIANHDHVPSGPAASYNMIPAERASTQLYMPQVVRDYYGFETGWQIYNLGPETVQITVTYFNTNGTVRDTMTHNIAAGAAFAQYLGDARGAGLGSNFNGGAVAEVTSGNGTLVGITNFVSPNGGDYQRVYNTFVP